MSSFISINASHTKRSPQLFWVEAEITGTNFWTDPVRSLLQFHVLRAHFVTSHYYNIIFEKCYCVVKSWPNWIAVDLPCAAPLVVGHESRQLFLSSSESSESGQRLPKINRLSVQPWGWVRVTHHGARSLGFSLPTSKHSASLFHWLRKEHSFYVT